MNENARALYEDLKAGRLESFDMGMVDTECGSPGCIVGHVYHRSQIDRSDWDSRALAYSWLGLKFDIGQSLCFPGDGRVWGERYEDGSLFYATQQQAAEALRRACELSEAQ